MKLHEYQAKELLSRFGVPVPEGYAAHTVEEAAAAAEKLGGDFWVVKAQVHAGGRGKAAQALCLIGSRPENHRGPTETGDHFREVLVQGKTGDQPGPKAWCLNRGYKNLKAHAVDSAQ